MQIILEEILYQGFMLNTELIQNSCVVYTLFKLNSEKHLFSGFNNSLKDKVWPCIVSKFKTKRELLPRASC